jgi:hypothetical protein
MNKFLAPNGKPSNLTPEQYKLVRTPEFKAWFGDWEKLILTKINDSGIDEISLKRLEDGVSKVVDSNGEPLVVFHTTDYLDEINVFRFNDDYSFQQWGYGIYFTNDKEHSESYFEGENYIVYEVFVNLKKPIITNQKEKGFNKKYFLEKRESSNESGAIIFHPDRRKWNYYIAGNPNQIKLADGTNTTFDAGNPDIRFEDGGAINKSNDFIGTWEELKKYNPNLWETGILRRSQNPQGATDIIPKDVHIRQGQWQNYGQYDEIEAETIYGEPDNYGYYNDEDGNSIIDERTGNYLKDEFDYENNAERIKATISNKQLKNNLIDSFQTQEGKEYLKKVIATLPKNEDGTITAYRIGTIGEDLQSYTLSEGMAKTFSNQGTDIMPSGLPSIPNEGYKDYGVLPVNKVKINPKGIVAWSPYDSEILVELKYIKTDNSKNSYADGGGVTDSYKIEFIDDRVLINRNDFGLLEFSIKENELEIRRLYLNKENQRVGIGRKIIGELFNQNPDVNKIIVYPLGSSIPFWLRFTEKVREDDYFEITKDSLKKGNENYPLKNNNRNDKFNDGGETQINEEAQQYIDIISMNPKLYKYQKYKVILKDKFGIDFDSIYKDQEYIDNANLNDIKKQDDFLHFDNWLNYAKIISKKRGFVPMDLYATPSDKYKLTDEIWNETSKNLDFIIKKIPYTERGTGSGDIARAFGDTIYYTDHADFYYFLHELGHIYDFQNNIKGIIKNPAYSPTNYGTTHSGETFAENFAIYFINPMALKNWNEDVYNAMDLEINEKYKNEINRIMPNNNDITFENGGDVIVNPTEIECHTCHWKWKVKDGGDDLFICHKCYTDNTKYYKFEGLEGEKILDTISYTKGGRTIAQTPAPKKDQIKGSDKNKEGSSKDLTSAKKIELSDSTIEAIKNKVDKHNEKHPKKKITIDSAKAVVRRGMGAYSTSYRPTISGGKPNSRVAWGLARLNAFLYKIVNGKSKSGKYSQDNDLIEELGYKVQKYSDGGLLGNTFTEIIYYAMLHTATTTDVYAKGKDLDDIQSEYNSISASDFDNPNSNYNSKMLESRINKYEFIGDDSLNAEDYIDDLENTDYWNLISDDYDIIESDSVFAINKSTDEMIDEIREFIKQEYNIGGRYAEKYMTISVDDENGDFIADLIIRTADHSQNVKNNDRTSFNLSFVIANKNETKNRFIPLGEEYYYDDNSDIEDIKEEIKGIIDDKIEEIKDKKKYADGGEADELNLTKNKKMEKKNTTDSITMNIPLLIRFAELMREDIKTDVALHEVIENIIDIKDKGVLTMSDYDSIIGNVIGTEENTNMNVVEEEKMEEGGKVESIKSKKGDIKLMLDENWYSDDTEVELVPVAELIKFREYDRKVSPKYNKENSVDNINHLKFMFQKDGVKSPLIIEYSKEDNAVLIIEGNHRLNSAIDLGMEYLPARVVLKKYSKFTKNQLKNAMKVSGVEGNEFGYIPSNMKPSKVGIQGTKPIVFGDGGIIEGRLHSECDAEEGCGRKFQVGENGHVIEAERDEAVIVADAFQNNEELTIKGTPSEVASALNVIGGGKNFDKGAEIIKNGQELDIPELKKQAIDTDVDDVIDSGSIIINRRSMADEKEYEVTGTPKQIASAINSLNGNGVVIEDGAEIKEN